MLRSTSVRGIRGPRRDRIASLTDLPRGFNTRKRSFSLLLLAWISCAAPLAAQQPYNYAEFWRNWPASAREAYVIGLHDGIADTYFTAWEAWAGALRQEQIDRVRVKVFLGNTQDQVASVMTNLYTDPANALVAWVDMAHIARDKLEGKEIDTNLRAARKRALDTFELNQKANKP